MSNLAQSDLLHRSAIALRQSFARRELSPVEVAAAVLDWIRAADEQVGAYLQVSDDKVGEAALESERRYRDKTPRVLEGVPVAIKDIFDTADAPTTYGSPIFSGHRPAADAVAVAHLRNAGALLVGKTRTDEFAYGITCANTRFGPSRNPWDPARVAGGSSGGSAAALASYQTALALGSDTGGSIRVPAAFCGVVGFKPTWGRISTEGMFPMARSLDHAGPMARTVADAALMFSVLAGHHGGRSQGVPQAHERQGDEGLRNLRVAVCPDLQLVELSSPVQRVFDEAVSVCASSGARIVECRFANASAIMPTFLTVQRAETVFSHERRGLFPARRAEYSEDIRERLEVAASVELPRYLEALEKRDELDRTFGRLFNEADLLVTPLAAQAPASLETPALEDAVRDTTMFFTVPENLLGMPACAIRAGFDELGLPVGIQIVGPRDSDERVLRAAETISRATQPVQNVMPALEPLLA